MKPYLRVTLAYAVFGLLWILLSDHVVGLLTSSREEMAYMQRMKGWMFVALSTLLILTISKRAFEDHARTHKEKQAVFNKTMEGSYHILLNYLNQMQLVTMEAEQCAGFDRKILQLSRTISHEATTELNKLRDIKTVTTEQIEAVVYEKLRKH
ncbi:MAG: hypothetical protein ABW223_11710 [Rariglobus sp.]